jgi:cytochrome c-type biogenesis protein CcmH/NrfF
MFRRIIRLASVVVVSVALIGASGTSTRFEKVGHKLMCTCGCAQVLLECNHVGCPNSAGMIAELHTQVDAGASDADIFENFAAKYGPIALAAPVRGGFDDVAWIVPFAILILGLAGVVFLLRLWRRRHEQLAAALPPLPLPTAADEALRERIRNETHYGQ